MSNEEELDEDTKRAKVRTNEQAFLMLNWQQITKESANNSSRFTQFAQIMHDNPAEINNLLFKKEPDCDIILKASSANLSYLTPKVRLFKEYVDQNGMVNSIEFPIISDYTDCDFQTMFQTKSGRGGGVGLKSFNWTTIGNSTGNMYSFGADIELFFESIEEITRIRRVDPAGTANQKIETSFVDLIIQESKNIAAGAYNPNYYRIKALIGWNFPNVAKQGFIEKEFIEEIRNSNLALYLSLHSHEIVFEENSSVTLKLKYIAYVEASMQSPGDSNVFYSSDSTYVTNIGTKKEEYQKLSLEYAEKQTPELERKLKKAEEEIKRLESENIEKVYSRILSYIYQNKTPSGASIIKYALVDEQAFETYTTAVGTKFENASQQQIDSFNSTTRALSNKTRILGTNTTPTSTVAKSNTPTTAEEVKQSIEKTLEEYEQELQKISEKQAESLKLAQSSGTTPPAYKVIPYFYLGDLLEAVLVGMYNANVELPQKDLKVILGPLRFYDYGNLYEVGEPQNKPSKLVNGNNVSIKYYSGKAETVNIADIPISLHTYSSWFLKNIVDAGILNMSFREFINLILNDLVLRTISIDTYSFAPRQRTKLVYKTKVLPENNRFLKNSAGYRYEANPYRESFKPFPPFMSDPNDYYDVENKKKLENILFIYGTANNPWELKSNYEEDIKKGIRHLYYGNETGMVKKINFKRQDNQLLRSHNIKLLTSQAADKSIMLREVYNADVDMFGNNVFEIGEIVYVSPVLFGISKTGIDHKDRETFAKSLGIGGYFQILKINNSISDGTYDTTLNLQWVAKGDGLFGDVLDSTNSNGIKIL